MSVRVVQWVIEHSPYSGNEYACLLMLAWHAKDDGTDAYPALDRLAGECRISRATLYRVLARLEESGAIAVTHQRGRGNRNHIAVVMENVSPVTPFENVSQNVSPGETFYPTKRLTAVRQKTSHSRETENVSPSRARGQNDSEQQITTREAPRANGVITPAQNAKVLAVRDELDARQLPSILTGKDKTKIAGCEADPATIVDAYEALRSNKWGDVWCRGNASVGTAADHISTYLTTLGRGPNPTLSGAGYLNSELNDEMERLLGRRPQPDQRRLPGGT